MLLSSTRPSCQRLPSISPRPSQLSQRCSTLCRTEEPGGHPELKELVESNKSDEAMDNLSPAFPSFPRLPPELRIKIWKIALLPRVITITPRLDAAILVCEIEVEVQQIELLSVCRESRSETLKDYTQISFNNDEINSMYINWSRDTLFLDLPDD